VIEIESHERSHTWGPTVGYAQVVTSSKLFYVTN